MKKKIQYLLITWAIKKHIQALQKSIGWVRPSSPRWLPHLVFYWAQEGSDIILEETLQ